MPGLFLPVVALSTTPLHSFPSTSITILPTSYRNTWSLPHPTLPAFIYVPFPSTIHFTLKVSQFPPLIANEIQLIHDGELITNLCLSQPQQCLFYFTYSYAEGLYLLY